MGWRAVGAVQSGRFFGADVTFVRAPSGVLVVGQLPMHNAKSQRLESGAPKKNMQSRYEPMQWRKGRVMLRFLSLLTLCFVALALPCAKALADDEIAKPSTATARDKLTAGTRLYRVREFEKAIEEYKAGALTEDAPVFYYNLGQCYRQLGKYEDAIWHYQRFLDRAPTAPRKYRDAAEGFIKEMKAELEKRAMTSQPTEPAPDGKSTPPPSPPAAHEDKPSVVASAATEPWYADAFGWGLTGTGVVATSVSGYLLLNASDLEDDANHEPSQETQRALRDKASQRRLAGTIVGVVGVGALVTGIIKLAIAPKRESTTTAALDVGVSSNGVFVMGRF